MSVPNVTEQTGRAARGCVQRCVGLLGLVITTRKEYDRQIMLAGLNGIQSERRVREIETAALRRTIQRLEGKQPNDKAEPHSKNL